MFPSYNCSLCAHFVQLDPSWQGVPALDYVVKGLWERRGGSNHVYVVSHFDLISNSARARVCA